MLLSVIVVVSKRKNDVSGYHAQHQHWRLCHFTGTLNLDLNALTICYKLSLSLHIYIDDLISCAHVKEAVSLDDGKQIKDNDSCRVIICMYFRPLNKHKNSFKKKVFSVVDLNITFPMI